ncbi:MAG: outer membrane beta-barrel protein [Bacteroidota bacterium]|nr:outer membrane beta-barrel protein [Bacteroidota bacterium]
MKKNIVILMMMVVVCAFGFSASAQQKLKMELSYNISAPLGSLKNDFINKTSFRGGSGELSYDLSPKFSLGLHSGFQSYYQKYDRQVYKLQGNQMVSAVVTNTMDIVPVMLRGTFFPMGVSATARLQPYLSAAAGINMVSYGQYLGEFGGTQASAPFAAQAGAGVKIPFGKEYNQTAFKIGATYNYAGYKRNELTNLNTVGFNAGVVFGLK